ncbi:uncharacterized protein BYT42DRAFT_117348 [Radiomyces spectabilis]|uniref:uncharacterized protein n=1 Tax=Radiomyces spectabilis TaxID=64574 RepID=UPI00221EAB67|nr:uncharacterized protein BYT42DRAFT_117348 [Radiomyces spectabilis]KAI8369645.1 hypothetical protein BYT42DRAFT_117348 [Radiomyces spectabilis]
MINFGFCYVKPSETARSEFFPSQKNEKIRDRKAQSVCCHYDSYNIMAAVDDKLFARLHDKAKEYDLSEQEIQTLATARQQLNTHTRLGGFIGSATAFWIGTRRKFRPLGLLALAGGGFLIGSQVGMISGMLASIKSIKTLPEPQHLVNAIKNMQNDMLQARGYKLDGPGGRPRAMTPEEREHPTSGYQPQMSSTSSGNFESTSSPDYHGNTEFMADQAENATSSSWNRSSSEPSADRTWNRKDMEYDGNANTGNTSAQSQAQQQSAWDRVRAENLPNNSWTKLRMQAQQNPNADADASKARTERINRLKDQDTVTSVDDLPRTREEWEKRSSTRTNQWGDAVN